MAETFQSHAMKMNECRNQLISIQATIRNIQTTLEYWKPKLADDDTEWLFEKANEFIDRAAKRIYTNELMGKEG